MPRTAPDLEALFSEEVGSRPCRCAVCRLPEDEQAFLHAKVAEYRAAGKAPPWLALSRTLGRAGSRISEKVICYHFEKARA